MPLGSRWGSKRFGCGAGTLWATWPSEGLDGLRLIGDMENWWFIMIYNGQSYGHGWFRATSMIFMESLKKRRIRLVWESKFMAENWQNLSRFVFIRPVKLALSQVECWSYIMYPNCMLCLFPPLCPFYQRHFMISNIHIADCKWLICESSEYHWLYIVDSKYHLLQ